MSAIAKKQNSGLKRQPSISSINNTSVSFAESKIKNKHQIEHLVSKFNEVNNQVHLDLTQAHFNLINYQKKNDKMKYDPQMMAAKLRKLENRAQIKRAEREIQNREKKRMKRFSVHKPENQHQNYKTIYKKFLLNNKLSEQFVDVSDDQSNENKSTSHGVAYFSQLKRHPLLLQYTLHKINEKQKIEQSKKKMESTLTKLKKQNFDTPGDYKDILQQFNKKLNQYGDTNPQNIIQQRFSKFYTKKSSDKLTKQVQSIPRCSKMIQKQNEIISEIQQRSLSKQNKQKLKSRLNQIINSISKSEKLSLLSLPRLYQTQRQTDKKQ